MRKVIEGEIAYLDALCLPRLLITLHPEAIQGMQGLAQALQRSSVPAVPTTSALVCVLLMHFSALSVQEAQRLRRWVRNLSDQMDRDEDALELEQLLAEKVAVRWLETLDEESSPVYAALRVTDTPALNLSDLQSYYEVVLSNTAFLTRIVDRLGANLDDLHQRYVVNMQEKTNKRLAFLTVVSAIFLPLTLLAGIYGMNFQFMPELNIPYAYPVALGVMLAIAVGLWRERLGLGASLYTSQGLYAPDHKPESGLLKPEQEGITVLGEAFVGLRLSEQLRARLFRHTFDVPYLNKRDIRMVPNTFEAHLLFDETDQRFSYANGDTDDRDENASPDQEELDFTIDFKPPKDVLQGLWLRARAAFVDEKGPDAQDLADYRLILNYELPLI